MIIDKKKIKVSIKKYWKMFLVKFNQAENKVQLVAQKYNLSDKKVVLKVLYSFFALFFIFVVWTFFRPLPHIENFHNRQVTESTKIYDRTGKILLYDIHGEVRRTQVDLNEIAPHMLKATIATEDKDFYKHSGFSVTAIIRALKEDLSSWELEQGGSTITQQLVKNTLLSNEKTISRKLKEVILAIRLEQKYTKDEILEAYLNETPYGGVVYGVEEASQYYFGVNAKDLSIEQSAYLAALPKGPTFYSPYGKNRDLLESRKNMILKEMQKEGYITEEEYNIALAEKVEFSDRTNLGIKAPHFVFYIKDQLIKKYGADLVEKGGLKVITTLDWDLQKKSEELLTKKALQNETRLRASNAGLVAIEPKTGHILAMVGSRGYFDKKIDGMVNIAVAKRQPGSSFKPFAYATAFKKGYTPETIIFDLKTQFSTACEPNNFVTTDICYSPSNYGDKIHGPISMRSALAQSVNIASVKVLYLAGINDSIDMAESLGISTLGQRNRFGLSLVLGGGEVTLLDITGAYGVFANDGVKNPTTGILSVENSKGEILETYTTSSTQVLDVEIARTISDILSDNPARAPEFGWNSALYFPNAQVAAKTGTTNDFRDAWIIGYNSSIAIGVWAGNNDNSPMLRRIAEASAAPLWHEVMDYAMKKNYPSKPFTKPTPMAEFAEIPEVLKGNWNPSPELGVHDILYWVNKENPQEGEPQNPWRDPQFALWEYPVQAWALATLTPEPSPITGTSTDIQIISTSTELVLY
ncbi:MAG: PBP1A family penicillin-binding protein [Patescibacteria group bacterium]